jgi:hypothetical protein
MNELSNSSYAAQSGNRPDLVSYADLSAVLLLCAASSLCGGENSGLRTHILTIMNFSYPLSLQLSISHG